MASGRCQSVGVVAKALMAWSFTITVCCILLLTPAFAAEPLLVEPGQSIVVDTADTVITDATGIFGTVEVMEVKEGGGSIVLYHAPDNLHDFAGTISVTYNVDGEERVREIEAYRSAQPENFSAEVYDASFKAVFQLFILALLIESGLQVLFRWRPYLSTFHTASVNGLIAFAFSVAVVSYFDLDIVTELIEVYTETDLEDAFWPVGFILTALIIAGGSSGVNRLLRNLGFRPVGLPAEVAGPREDNYAWISVKLERVKAHGPVDVLFGEENKEAVIGTIHGTGKWSGFRKLLFRDPTRFPSSGGFTVDVGGPYYIKLCARDAKGGFIKEDKLVKWGPKRIGKRAIVDVTFRV